MPTSLSLPASSWRLELRYFLAAYLVYNAARWVFAGELGPAAENAGWVMDLERSTGTAIEGSVQAAFSSDAWSTILSNVYLAAQLAVLPGALIWLYRRSRPVYRALRNTVLATWMIAVPIFALWPVAPPRLVDAGMIDTVSEQAAVALTGHSTIFYNPYAAVPSLHVGFAFAIGIAAAAALRAPWARALALLWGPIVTLSVLATANHYVFDAAAGLLVTAIGFKLVPAIRRAADASGPPAAAAAA